MGNNPNRTKPATNTVIIPNNTFIDAGVSTLTVVEVPDIRNKCRAILK